MVVAGAVGAVALVRARVVLAPVHVRGAEGSGVKYTPLQNTRFKHSFALKMSLCIWLLTVQSR